MFNCRTAAQKNPRSAGGAGERMLAYGMGGRPWPRDQPTGEMKLLTGAGRPLGV